MSAGRVQSVAVKLIIEREREIQAFKPEESWKLFADITYNKYTLRTTLAKIGKDEAQLRSFDDVQHILSQYSI
ncbi:MAG: DNA topoisomerase [bacterium]